MGILEVTSRADNVETYRRFYEAIERGDLNQAAADLASSCSRRTMTPCSLGFG
jgi:ketosteroid isomerase-like protein